MIRVKIIQVYYQYYSTRRKRYIVVAKVRINGQHKYAHLVFHDARQAWNLLHQK